MPESVVACGERARFFFSVLKHLLVGPFLMLSIASAVFGAVVVILLDTADWESKNGASLQ